MMKAIYWPDVANEVEEEERKEALKKRLIQISISLGLFAGVNFSHY